MPTGKLVESRRMNCQEENTSHLEEFLKEMRIEGRSEHTITAYRFAVRDFLDFTLGLNLRQVKHQDIREWLHWIQAQGAGPQTMAQRKYALSSFFQFLQRTEMVKDSRPVHCQSQGCAEIAALPERGGSRETHRRRSDNTGPRFVRIYVLHRLPDCRSGRRPS